MTPKEKAKELVDAFKPFSYYDAHDLTSRISREESRLESAKECALIAVNLLIKDNCINEEIINGGLRQLYWKEVGQEIEKL